MVPGQQHLGYIIWSESDWRPFKRKGTMSYITEMFVFVAVSSELWLLEIVSMKT